MILTSVVGTGERRPLTQARRAMDLDRLVGDGGDALAGDLRDLRVATLSPRVRTSSLGLSRERCQEERRF